MNDVDRKIRTQKEQLNCKKELHPLKRKKNVDEVK